MKQLLSWIVLNIYFFITILWPGFSTPCVVILATTGIIGVFGRFASFEFMESNLDYPYNLLLLGIVMCICNYVYKRVIKMNNMFKRNSNSLKILWIVVINVCAFGDVCLVHFLSSVTPYQYGMTVGIGLVGVWILIFLGVNGVFFLKNVKNFGVYNELVYVPELIAYTAPFVFKNFALVISYNGFYKGPLGLSEVLSVYFGVLCYVGMCILAFIVYFAIKNLGILPKSWVRKKPKYDKLENNDDELDIFVDGGIINMQ